MDISLKMPRILKQMTLQMKLKLNGIYAKFEVLVISVAQRGYTF
ncbi:Uncharacterised protein [Mycobacteroides abscessus subsp. abscessus]|nr:Uncharacterised protein [Mycobacteroides abscessus subsp. abscessus]